ncbi:MAG: TlpA family protein disulfide reductase [Acidobacteria bacterium]|nr:TlpA family protein disulfide reductase [Acidobacteriota bacterium]MCI0664626.1 TlpA family protein disulfide reductase [Acidobacteriota bacterium]
MLKNLKVMVVLAFAAVTLISSAVYAQDQSFTLRSTSGQTVNLNDLRGKVVVLSFGGTWVPLATKELPALQKLADRFAGRDVQFYWVSINSAKPGARNYAPDADLQAFAQKHNLRLTILRDPEQEVYRAFGLDALPTLVVLDRQGKVARKHVGFGTDQGESYNQIIRDVEQLLK